MIKAFVAEIGSEQVLRLLAETPSAATSRLSFVECHAAFARAKREGRLTASQASAVARSLDQRWSDVLVVEMDDALSRRASVIARDHGLRAADAIHLASAEVVAGGAPQDATFACWDARLWDGASSLGFTLVPGARPA